MSWPSCENSSSKLSKRSGVFHSTGTASPPMSSAEFRLTLAPGVASSAPLSAASRSVSADTCAVPAASTRTLSLTRLALWSAVTAMPPATDAPTSRPTSSSTERCAASATWSAARSVTPLTDASTLPTVPSVTSATEL